MDLYSMVIEETHIEVLKQTGDKLIEAGLLKLDEEGKLCFVEGANWTWEQVAFFMKEF